MVAFMKNEKALFFVVWGWGASISMILLVTLNVHKEIHLLGRKYEVVNQSMNLTYFMSVLCCFQDQLSPCQMLKYDANKIVKQCYVSPCHFLSLCSGGRVKYINHIVAFMFAKGVRDWIACFACHYIFGLSLCFMTSIIQIEECLLTLFSNQYARLAGFKSKAL
uniref:Uncharacterized protein n=1 Tax=Rhizophora mucronata TaxID=61149 RepID=A0A2P2JJE0_RHIMU